MALLTFVTRASAITVIRTDVIKDVWLDDKLPIQTDPESYDHLQMNAAPQDQIVKCSRCKHWSIEDLARQTTGKTYVQGCK